MYISDKFRVGKLRELTDEYQSTGFMLVESFTSLGVRKVESYLKVQAQPAGANLIGDFVISDLYIEKVVDDLSTRLMDTGIANFDVDDFHNEDGRLQKVLLDSYIAPKLKCKVSSKVSLFVYTSEFEKQFKQIVIDVAQEKGCELGQTVKVTKEMVLENNGPEVIINESFNLDGGKTLQKEVQSRMNITHDQASYFFSAISQVVISEAFQKSYVDAVKHRIEQLKLENLSKLVVYFQGLESVEPHDRKLTDKLVDELLTYSDETLYIHVEKLDIPGSIGLFKNRLGHDVLTSTKEKMIQSLHRQLSNSQDPALSLHLSVLLFHAQYCPGVLRISGKHIPKVLKALEVMQIESDMLKIFLELKDAIVGKQSPDLQKRLAQVVKTRMNELIVNRHC